MIAAEAMIVRNAAPAMATGTVVVDGYVRSAAPSGWSASLAAIDLSLIARCTAGRGWRLGCVFQEPGPCALSDGGSLLRATLSRIESGESDGLVVARMKHLGCSLQEAVAVLERIAAAGGRFVSVRDGIDLSTPSGRLILRLLLSALEW